MEEEHYRNELRNHFMGQVKNSKLQKYCSNTLTESTTTSPLKDHTYHRIQQKLQHEIDLTSLSKAKQQTPQPRASGGDADRLLFDSVYGPQTSTDSYTNYNLCQLHPKTTTPPLPVNPSTSGQKCCSDECNERFLFDADSNLCGIGDIGSEDSAKTHKTSKTVVSRRSSEELRKMVKSKCKLHEEIDQTLKQMCQNNDLESTASLRVPQYHLKEQDSIQHCKRCTSKIKTGSTKKDVMTGTAKGDFECRNGEMLTISVDDVVNSKVINPMIRKLQRMYLNNLKEEMSLMEDLERLPHKVNEVYKATIFKQKD